MEKHKELFPPDPNQNYKKLKEAAIHVSGEEATDFKTELFPPDPTVTTDDYHAAFEEYGSISPYEPAGENNPGFSRSRDVQRARVDARIARMELSLKKRGLMEATKHELLEFELDKVAGPTAKHGDITEYKNKKYKLRFVPLAKSHSGKTVQTWGRKWSRVKE